MVDTSVCQLNIHVTSATLGRVTDVSLDLDLDLAQLAIWLMDRTKQDVRAVADEQGLSIAQLDVLRRLGRHGPSPMRRLAEQMNCEASNLTGLVDRLERRGLVTRLNDPDDRRVRLLALTPDGKAVSHAAWVGVARRCSLNLLPEERRVVLNALLHEARRAAGREADQP